MSARPTDEAIRNLAPLRRDEARRLGPVIAAAVNRLDKQKDGTEETTAA